VADVAAATEEVGVEPAGSEAVVAGVASAGDTLSQELYSAAGAEATGASVSDGVAEAVAAGAICGAGVVVAVTSGASAQESSDFVTVATAFVSAGWAWG
jgi:hypothetical protein